MLKSLIKTGSRLILIAILVICSSNLKYNKILVTRTSNIEDFLKTKKYYDSILDYTNYKSKDLNITFINKYGKSLKPKVFELSDSDNVKVEKLINYINTLSYNEKQNDPTKISVFGGNCQARSLLVKEYMDECSIYNTIIRTENHMYNRIKLGDKLYDVDTVKNKFTEVNFIGGNNEEFR